MAGGTLTLDGIKITVPDNALVKLPAISVAWQELSAPNAMPGFGSPGVTWAATVRAPVECPCYMALPILTFCRFKATS